MKSHWLSGVAIAAGMVLAGARPGRRSTIGVAGPITGPNAAFGAQLQKGAEQAARRHQRRRRRHRRAESRSNSATTSPIRSRACRSANKFVGDGVKFVDGHFNSGVSIPASEVYAENGILQITPAATNPVSSPSADCGTRSAPAVVTISRARSPASISPINYKRQEGRRHPRQDALRPGPRRRDQEGDERGRRDRSRCMKASTSATRTSRR